MKNVVVLILTSCSILGLSARQQPSAPKPTTQANLPLLRIWTAAPAEGIVDEDSLRRQRTIAQTRARVSSKLATFVDEPSDRVVSIEVFSVGKVASGNTVALGFGYTQGLKRLTMLARITYRSYVGDLVCDTSTPYTEDLGKSCAKKIEIWLKDNRAVLTK